MEFSILLILSAVVLFILQLSPELFRVVHATIILSPHSFISNVVMLLGLIQTSNPSSLLKWIKFPITPPRHSCYKFDADGNDIPCLPLQNICIQPYTLPSLPRGFALAAGPPYSHAEWSALHKEEAGLGKLQGHSCNACRLRKC